MRSWASRFQNDFLKTSKFRVQNRQEFEIFQNNFSRTWKFQIQNQTGFEILEAPGESGRAAYSRSASRKGQASDYIVNKKYMA